MSKPPFYWSHHESCTIGVEYCEETLERILAGPEPIDMQTEEVAMKLVQEGYTLERPWILQPAKRQECFDKLKSAGFQLEQLKAHFQNPGVDIRQAYAEMQQLVNVVNQQLYEVLLIASTNAVQEVPEDL